MCSKTVREFVWLVILMLEKHYRLKSEILVKHCKCIFLAPIMMYSKTKAIEFFERIVT